MIENVPYPKVIPLVSREAPVASTERPEPPEWLTEKGREAWDRYAPLYAITERDLPEFVAYCEAIGEFHETTEMLAEVGLVVLDPASGMPEANPVLSIRDRADRKLASWSERFRGH